MATRQRPVDRARRLARQDGVRAGSELRLARQIAGLSLRAVGAGCGISSTQVWRIESGLAPSVSLEQLARVGAVVGLDVRTRTYPGPDPLRDVGQVRLLERLLARLPPGVTLRTEVPLPMEGDLRAWDGWITGLARDPAGRGTLAAEAETRFVDAQAQIRRIELKRRDAGVDHVLLVVADTTANRAAVAAVAALVDAAYPISARRALGALAEGRHPGGSALVFL